MVWEVIIELSGGWRLDFLKILISKKGGRGELVMVMFYFLKKKIMVLMFMVLKLNMIIYDLKLKFLY